MNRKWLTISIIIFYFKAIENKLIENATFIVDPLLIRNAEEHDWNIYIGATLEKFLSVENKLKAVIGSNADTYCHNKKMLSTESHLSASNVTLINCSGCPKDWPHSTECVQCILSIELETENFMKKPDLKNVWQAVQHSDSYKQLGLQSYETKPHHNYLITVLSILVGILLLIVIGLLYLLRERIRIFCVNLCDREDKTSDLNYFTNSAFTEDYDQRDKTVLSILPGNASDSKTISQNAAYVETNSSISENTTTSTMLKTESTAPTELVDDFDSDNEIEFSFPSPLTPAPPLPPRPVKNQETSPVTSSSGKQMHYMVSKIY